jgi:ribosomal protein S1
LDPYDASLIGRNFVLDYLRHFEQGTQFSVTIEEINESTGRVRATRLRTSENAMLQFMGKQKERTVSAAIVEVRDNGLYIWLEPSETRDHMPCGAFAYIGRLPQRPDEMSLGQACRAIVRPRQWQKPLRRSLTSLPDGVAEKLKQQRIGNNLEWGEESHTLVVKGRISYDQRHKLLELSEDGGYRRAINILFRRSNELDIKIVDVTGLQIMQAHQLANKPVPAKVISVDDRGAEVEVEGFRTWVPKREAAYDPTKDLREKFRVGDNPEIYVKEVNEEKGEAVVSLLNPAEDPLNDYQPGQILHGHVANIVDYGAYVELTPGVQGLVHISRLAWWRIEGPTEIVHRGQSVKVQIIDINREERQLDLTMCLPENDPFRQFQVNQRVQGKVVGFTNDGNGAFVELTPGVEGFLYKDEIHTERVPNARSALSEGQQVLVRITELDRNERKLRLTVRGLYEAELWVPDSHKGVVIGKGGSSIKEIQQDTNTYINLNDDGHCSIQGMTQTAVNQAVQRIQVILATRIVTFSIQSRQVPMLIGKSGSTIKGIQTSTGAQIDVDSNAGKVIVTAANDIALQRTLEQIRSAISFYEATIQVPSHLTGRVIGRGGETINSIRNHTGVRIDILKDGSGRIVVEGKSSYEVGRAVTMIQAQTGSATYLSNNEGTLPAYTEVHTSTPGINGDHSQQLLTNRSFSRQPSTSPPPESQPVKKLTAIPKPVAQPSSHQQEFRVNANQIAVLTRKQGGFFTSIFGGGKSTIEKIQAVTGVQIKVDTSTNTIKVVGRSPQAVTQAVTAIQQALR